MTLCLGIDPGATFGAALWGDRGLLWSATMRLEAQDFTDLERVFKPTSRAWPTINAVAIEGSFAPNPVEEALKAIKARKPASVVAAILQKGRGQSVAKKLLENRGILKGFLMRAIPDNFDWIEPMPSTWRKAIHGRATLTKEEKLVPRASMAKVYDVPRASALVGRQVSTHEAAAILLASYGHTEARVGLRKK